MDKILKGTKPADLRLDQPSKYDLFISAATLRALGLTVPATVAPLVSEWIP